MRAHSRLLHGDPDTWLFVLTPNPVRPTWFDALDGVEEARFLLNELVALYEADGLLTNDDTVVVAARVAWPEYNKYSSYVCQPNRSFRDGLTHLGFYTERAIQPLLPRIEEFRAAVPFTDEEVKRLRGKGDSRVADLIEALLRETTRTKDEAYGIMLLSGPEAKPTVRLEHPVESDTVTATKRRWAWSLSQRYTELQRLRSGVRYTSKL